MCKQAIPANVQNASASMSNGVDDVAVVVEAVVLSRLLPRQWCPPRRYVRSTNAARLDIPCTYPNEGTKRAKARSSRCNTRAPSPSRKYGTSVHVLSTSFVIVRTASPSSSSSSAWSRSCFGPESLVALALLLSWVVELVDEEWIDELEEDESC